GRDDAGDRARSTRPAVSWSTGRRWDSPARRSSGVDAHAALGRRPRKRSRARRHPTMRGVLTRRGGRRCLIAVLVWALAGCTVPFPVYSVAGKNVAALRFGADRRE